MYLHSRSLTCTQCNNVPGTGRNAVQVMSGCASVIFLPVLGGQLACSTVEPRSVQEQEVYRTTSPSPNGVVRSSKSDILPNGTLPKTKTSTASTPQAHLPLTGPGRNGSDLHFVADFGPSLVEFGGVWRSLVEFGGVWWW